MSGNKIVLELEQRLKNDKDDVLFNEIVKNLTTIEAKLKMESQKMQTKETFKLIEAAEKSLQGAQLAMQLFKAS
jgi:hypothetical protein